MRKSWTRKDLRMEEKENVASEDAQVHERKKERKKEREENGRERLGWERKKMRKSLSRRDLRIDGWERKCYIRRCTSAWEKGRERGERKRKTRLRKEEVIHNKGHFFPNNRKPSEWTERRRTRLERELASNGFSSKFLLSCFSSKKFFFTIWEMKQDDEKLTHLSLKGVYLSIIFNTLQL